MRALPAAPDPDPGRVRLGQRRRRADVHRRGARRAGGPDGAPVRRPGGQAAREAAGGDRDGARGRVHLQRAALPPARQPRSASERDRGLPGLPVPDRRPDRAERGLHARQLLDQAAAPATRPGSRGSTAARRCARSGRGPSGCTRSTTRRRRCTRRRCSRPCGPTSSGSPSCSRWGAGAAGADRRASRATTRTSWGVRGRRDGGRREPQPGREPQPASREPEPAPQLGLF